MVVKYDYYPIPLVPTGFSADADFRKRGIIGTVVPGSTRVDDRTYHILYDYTAQTSTTKTIRTDVQATQDDDGHYQIPTTFSADADFKKRGISGTVVPNSTDLDYDDVGMGAPLVTYEYIATSDRPAWNWFDKLITHKVAGKTASPIDADPVSVLSGGLGITYEYVGPGVPSRLKAHSSANWDTTPVGRDSGTAIVPPRP